MAYIIRNNVKYAGGSGSGSGDNAIECTMAEYEAFEAQGKVIPNTTYYITDYTENENISLDASNVVFDDTDTQMGVDNVQDAIEKLNTNIDEQNKNLQIIDYTGINVKASELGLNVLLLEATKVAQEITLTMAFNFTGGCSRVQLDLANLIDTALTAYTTAFVDNGSTALVFASGNKICILPSEAIPAGITIYFSLKYLIQE